MKQLFRKRWTNKAELLGVGFFFPHPFICQSNFYINKPEASQCGYVVSTLASRQGDLGSNPRAARKSCEVYPGLGILQPQWNPYPTLTPPSC